MISSNASANAVKKCFLLLWVTLGFLVASEVRAADYQKLSEFERRLVDKAMALYNLELEPHPEDKTIGQFHVYTENPFAPEDGFLNVLNYLHVTTKDRFLVNQFLMTIGDQYSENLVIQTEIELVDPRTRSLALIFPVRIRGQHADGQVDLLVVTRDVFSLRLNADIELAGKTINHLTFGVSESNIAGSNKLGSLTFKMSQYVFEILAQYYDPDVFFSGHEVYVDQGVIFNRATGGYEGLRGRLQVSYPLDAETTEWGYDFRVDYAYEPRLDFDGNKIRIYAPPNSMHRTERKYRWLEVNGSATATRSYGRSIKNNITFGYGLSLNRPTQFEDFNLSGQAAQDFISSVLPIRELQSFLYLGYSHFWNRFVAMYDVNTFVLEEWVRLGPSFSISNQFAARPLFSDYNFLHPIASFSLTFAPIASSLIRAHVEGETRFDGSLVNNRVQADLYAVSPKIFGIGRFVMSAVFAKWWDDFNNRSFSLGGDSGLRGIVSGFYSGTNLVRTNVEFRSVSLPIWVFRLGGAAFYDWGAAFNDSDQFDPTHALGLGARIQFIPFMRGIFRIDVAVPLSGPRSGIQNTLLTLGVGQAF